MQDRVVFEGDCNLSVPFDGDMNVLINVMQGMETETGEWVPEASVQRGNIAFSKNHTDAPAIVLLWDATSTQTPIQTRAGKAFTFIDYEKLNGGYVKYGANGKMCGIAHTVSGWIAYVTQPDVGTVLSDGVGVSLDRTLEFPHSSPDKSARYYATETGFMPLAGDSTAYIWVQGRTYKWIAIWADLEA